MRTPSHPTNCPRGPLPRKPEHRDRARRHLRDFRDEEVPLPALRSQLLPGPQPLLPHGLGPALARKLGRSRGSREALLLRRGLVREAHLLREAAGRGRPRPQDEPVGRSAPGDRPGAGRADSNPVALAGRISSSPTSGTIGQRPIHTTTVPQPRVSPCPSLSL